jgi:site-specific DNA-methyltransferase (adenine-specific)
MSVRLEHGDMLAILPTLGQRFHAVVTDPPYHLVSGNAVYDLRLTSAGNPRTRRAPKGGFMGKQWDGGDIAFRSETWALVGSVMLPGAHLVAFAGTKGAHRMACAIEDAGFEIRDTLAWLYGSGFPKSHNAKGDWEGWGTALKPAYEPIVLARWPMSAKTVAANLAEHRCGAINVDACRVELNGDYKCKPNGRPSLTGLGDNYDPAKANQSSDVGRWPANVVHDGSEEVLAAFPDSAGGQYPARGARFGYSGGERKQRGEALNMGDSGSAARFFKSVQFTEDEKRFHYSSKADAGDRLQSKHPTVKPVDLMRWLVRLVTPKGGLVLDPFAGSGTTGMACMAEGFDCTLIEREAEYAADIRRRIAHVSGNDAPLFAKPRIVPKQEALL